MPDSQLLLNALSALRTGKLNQAEALLKTLISAEPKHVAGLNLLAILLMQLRRYEEAEIFIQRALNENAMSDASHYNYGLILKALRHPAEALKQFTQALKIGPAVAETWNNRGTVFRDLRRYREALADFDQAISLNPNYADALCNRGNVYADLKQYNDASASYERALNLKPDLANAWLGRGNVSADLYRYDQAFTAYDTALSINPDLADAWLGRGNVFWSLKRYDEALAAYDKALSIEPDLEHAWLGRGNIFADLKRYDEAFAAYDKALSIKPDLAGAWLGRGNVFSDLNQYDEAFAAYDKALSIEPELAEVHHGRANILHVLGRNDEALNFLNRAIELDPINAQAHLSRSLVLLTLGQYAEAWDDYEWRRKLPVPFANRTFIQASLPDLACVEGATVFLYGEQGWGDYIHFCRYAKMVSDKGAKVVLETPKPLFQLCRSLRGVSQLIELDQTVPPFDYHCPLMSLPRIFQTTLDNVPNKVPYLFAEPDKVQAWANKLGARSKSRIGLVWSGGFLPNQPGARLTQQRRNVPLAKFFPLKAVDADFYSLQKGEPAVSELKELLSSGWNGPAIINRTDEIDDFSDTAALIQNLDLVISVDTSTAHLAGAMAKPVWLLNRFDIEWRWLPSSPWYPTIKLYRQKEADNWDDVIENVKTDLIRSLDSGKFLP